MTILITGAGGFLGRRLTEVLAGEEEPVRVLVRSAASADVFAGLPVEVRIGRLEDSASLAAAVAGVRRVIHCAALSSDWGRWDEFFEANVAGVERLLVAARNAGGVESFVHISTTDVYGFPPVPCREDARWVKTRIPYSRSKGMGERLALRFGKRHGLGVTVLRPASIYGPRCKPWVIEVGNLLRQGFMLTVARGRVGAGLIYVDDVLEAIRCVWRNPTAAAGRCYNLIGPERNLWHEYFDALADGMGVKRARFSLPEGVGLTLGMLSESCWGLLRMRSRPLITRHAVLLLSRDQNYPTDRARDELGFAPRVGLAEGMRRTLDWLASPEGSAAVPRG